MRAVTEFWPVLTETLNTFGSFQVIAESIAKNFKNIVSSYRYHSLPLVGNMAEVLVSAFEQYEYGCFLWASGAIVRTFGYEEGIEQVQYHIWQFVERQCVSTFHLLERHKPNEIPEGRFLYYLINVVIEDFFRLLIDSLFARPNEFTKSTLMSSMVEAALASLSLELENPLTAVLHFLRDYMDYAAGHGPAAMEQGVPHQMQAAFRGVVQRHGATMCNLLISGMIFTFPRDCVVDGAGALMTLIEIDPENSGVWIATSLATLPSENFSDAERNRFLLQISK
jgi:transportin-3